MDKTIQVLAAFKNQLLAFPPYVAAFDELERLLQFYRQAGIPKYLMVTGETGAGKSTLCREFAARYSKIVLREVDLLPVLAVQVPTPATLGSLAEEILKQLGDPGPNIGTLSSKTRRIITLIRGCKVEAMILDETQHISEKGQRYSQYMAADWLKRLIEEIQVSVAFVGMPNLVQLAHTNEQLRRRFSTHISLQLDPERDGDAGAACLQMYISLGATLGLKLTSHPYTWDELGTRLHYGTDGRIGYIKNLLSTATEIAMADGCNELSPAILERAFTHSIWRNGIERLNPFHHAFVFRRLDRGTEPFAPTSAIGRR